jgi:hypothetical protein
MLIPLFAALLAQAPPASADEAIKREFFERKIRPVLVGHCYECHDAAAAKADKLKGLLQLDHREGLLAGGESGPTIVPGKPAESLLLKALKHDGIEMPPEGKLPAQVVADFEQWIADGAFDPREGLAASKKREVDFTAARDHWSYRPVVPEYPPEVQNAAWVRNEVDRFVLAKLESAGLSPSTEADDRILVRRLHFDLIGLPPTPEEVASFLERASVDREVAIEELVDRLLASPHFGERWGRHWLDVVRFAESNGRDQNIVWHHAWRYRQYVVDAFNADKPFDRFVREQIAGDLLSFDTPQERDAAITATGMLAMSPKTIDEANKALFRMDLIDDQIEVTTRAFLGLSVSCARCHDHKFDPIPTKDYYALAGIFASSEPLYGPARWGTKGSPHKHYRAVGPDAESLDRAASTHVQELEQAHLDFTQARVDRYGVVRKVADLKNQLMKPEADASLLEPEIARMEAEILVWDEKIKQLGKALEAKIAHPPPQPQWVMALREGESPFDCQVHIRGETNNLGESLPRGVLQLIVLPGLAPISEQESGRRQLADWLASEHNPLTPRVAVNRVWMHLFGRGLVGTVDDFGNTGGTPSHGELLDFLATRFVEREWSTKSLIRLLATSRTYRQASDLSAVSHDRDPDNALLWRMNPRRFDVEAFRDAVLSTAGELDRSPPAIPFLGRFNPYKEHTWAAHDAFLKPQDMEFPHRTLYLPVIRGVLPELFTLFDFADPSRVVGQRNESVVPAQALFLMNSPWILERSGLTAEQVLASESLDDSAALGALFERALQRPPTEAEAHWFMEYLRDLEGDPSTESRVDRWSRVCQIIFASAEFRTVR